MRIHAAIATIAVTLLGLFARESSACGHCDEDKVASTYDHAVVSRALARGHHVAFFKIEGPAPRSDTTRKAIEDALYSVAGVDSRSARISLETSTVSCSFDPSRVSMTAINTQLDRKLSARRIVMTPLRVMVAPGDLKTVFNRQ